MALLRLEICENRLEDVWGEVRTVRLTHGDPLTHTSDEEVTMVGEQLAQGGFQGGTDGSLGTDVDGLEPQLGGDVVDRGTGDPHRLEPGPDLVHDGVLRVIQHADVDAGRAAHVVHDSRFDDLHPLPAHTWTGASSSHDVGHHLRSCHPVLSGHDHGVRADEG